eukprot:TRINITY_DN4798_c0_g1_i1.p1 TRINITY_DN4798_c0_g1~~TRINITY_DN4798_c0_g1_i1.p1  ORF type:complete len:1057 (-),score=198.67 TRINITY_DN4798_c0_g1_i1:157-3327(-)
MKTESRTKVPASVDGIFLRNSYYPKDEIKSITLVQAVIRKKLTKKHLKKMIASNFKRKNICNEIFTTEESYLSSLESLMTGYFEPLSKEFKDLKEKKRNEIFGNIQQIFERSKSLLNTMRLQFVYVDNKQKDKLFETQQLGSIFLKEVVPYLHMYRDYCATYDKSMAILNENKFDDPKSTLGQFLKRCQETHNLMENQTISSYLIMPVQRLTRYKLFFEELKKLTATSDTDHEPVITVLDKISEVAVTANTLLKQRQSMEKIASLQKRFIGKNIPNLVHPARLLLKEGQLSKICRKDVKVRYFILLTDLLIYGSEQYNLYNIHRLMAITNIKMLDLPDDPKREYKNAIQISSQAKSFVVTAETNMEKKKWIESYQEALKYISVHGLPQDFSSNPNELVLPNSPLPPTNNEAVNALVSPKANRKTMTIANANSVLAAAGNASQLGGSSTNVTHPENNYVAPVWQPDSSQNNCTYCQTVFTVFRRRHHCRNCGALVCGPCSEHQFQLPMGLKRVCDQCFAKLSKQQVGPSRRRSTITGSSTGSAVIGSTVDKHWMGVSPTVPNATIANAAAQPPPPTTEASHERSTSYNNFATISQLPVEAPVVQKITVPSVPIRQRENGEILPYHLFYKVMSHLGIGEVCQGMLVCRHWARQLESDWFWAIYLPKIFPHRRSVRRSLPQTPTPLTYLTSPPSLPPAIQTCKQLFRRCHLSSINWKNKRYILKRNLRGHTDSVNGTSYSDGSGGGKFLASVSNDATLRLWSLDETSDETLAPKTTLTGHNGPIRALEVWWEGSRIYTAGKDKIVRAWDSNTGQIAGGYKTGSGPLGNSGVLSLSFDPDWSPLVVASAYQDGNILLWDMRARNDAPALAFRHSPGQMSWPTDDLAQSKDGKKKKRSALPIELKAGRLVSGGGDGTLKLWSTRMAEGGEGRRTKHLFSIKCGDEPVECLSFDNRHVVAGTGNSIYVWSSTTSSAIILSGHSKGVSSLQLEGSKLVSGSRDETVKVWDLDQVSNSCLEQTFHCKNKKEGSKIAAKSRAVCFGDDRLVSACSDHCLRVWEFL